MSKDYTITKDDIGIAGRFTYKGSPFTIIAPIKDAAHYEFVGILYDEKTGYEEVIKVGPSVGLGTFVQLVPQKWWIATRIKTNSHGPYLHTQALRPTREKALDAIGARGIEPGVTVSEVEVPR